jgi:SAM-dependent methyltransferase
MNWKSLGRALRGLGPISVLLAGLWAPDPVRAQFGSAAPSAQRKTSTPYTGDLSIFDAPGRDERLQINRVMDMLGIEPGKNVADIGAGSGWFTVRAARRVTGSGTVYAVDINPQAIQYIDQRGKKEQLPNIKTILSKPDDPQLPADGIDAVLLLKTYHEVAHPVVLLRNLHPSLKPGAKIGIIDRNGNGADHGVSKDVVVREAAPSRIRTTRLTGFRESRRHGLFSDLHSEAGLGSPLPVRFAGSDPFHWSHSSRKTGHFDRGKPCIAWFQQKSKLRASGLLRC